MDDTKDAWDEVGNRFGQLAGLLRERYEAAASREGTPTEEREKVEQAVRALVDVFDRAFTAVGEAVRDPAFRDEAKQAAGALGEALGATLTDVGNEIRRTFGGAATPPAAAPGEGAPPEPPAGKEPPATG